MEADQPVTRAAAAPERRPKRASSGLRRRRQLLAWVFMLPLVVVNVLVILGPSVATIYASFTEWSGIGPAEFVGLQNYREILTDGDFYLAMWHNVVWTALFLTVPIGMGLLGAFLLSQITRFQMFFRVAYFIPYVVASVVNAALWQNILDPDRGIGSALASVGIPFLDGVSFFGASALRCPPWPASTSGPGGASSCCCSLRPCNRSTKNSTRPPGWTGRAAGSSFSTSRCQG